MRDEQQEHRVNSFAPYPNERHCSNCEGLAGCWSRDNEALPPWRPVRFALREGWPAARESDYLKRIHGGICANFVMHGHVNVELNKVDPRGWDR